MRTRVWTVVFLVNLAKKSNQWEKGSVNTESLIESSISVQKVDHLIPMDIKKGYQHFRLSPRMRNWFMFYYHSRFFRLDGDAPLFGSLI